MWYNYKLKPIIKRGRTLLKSQELQMKMSELRERANKLAAIEPNATQHDEIRAEIAALEPKFRDALADEAARTAGAFGDDQAEHRERTNITGRADLGALVGALVSRRALITGSAEAEAQAAWGLPGDSIPLAMLTEYRTTAAPADGGGPQGFVGYRFPSSVGEFANVQRPRVAPGTAVYPSITSASVANRPAEAGESTDSDPTLRGELLTPKRVQANTKISVEDRARFGGMAEAIAMHLAGAVAAGFDQQALVGDEGFFDTSSGPLTAQTDPGSSSTWANYADMLGESVDGRFASTPAEIGLLMGQDTYADGSVLYRTNQSDENVMAMIARVGRLRVSAAMPAKSGNIQNILAVRGTVPAAVQPLWDGLTIEDVYSRSGHGEISFAVVGLADFSVTLPDAYRWLRSNLS